MSSSSFDFPGAGVKRGPVRTGRPARLLWLGQHRRWGDWPEMC